MEKLYEILISYEDGSVDLIKLEKEEIEDRIKNIVSGDKEGKLYVIEIDTLQGAALVLESDNIICYYDQPVLAHIVAKNNKLKEKPQEEMTVYVEKTIKELEF
jgi:hypothetical protein